MEELNHALQKNSAIMTREDFFAGTLGVGHEARHVFLSVTDTGDIEQGTIRVGFRGSVAVAVAIAPEDLPVCLHLFESFRVGEVAAFPVGDRDSQERSFRGFAGKGRIGFAGAQPDEFAAERDAFIADQRSGQESGFTQYLEPVADAQHQSSAVGELLHSSHDVAVSGNGAGAQIISIAETARDYDCIGIAQAGLFVPKQAGIVSQNVFENMNTVLVTITSRKLKNGKIHNSA